MHFPTYQQPANHTIHIISDQHTCMCGLCYHSFYELTRRDLRNIKFRDISVVDCKECLEKLKQSLNPEAEAELEKVF